MTDRAKQITTDVVKALMRHGPWGVLLGLLLLHPQLITAATDTVSGRTDKKIAQSEERAVAASKAYADEQTNALSRDVAAIKEKLSHLDATVKESVAEQKQTNRQVGELVGELRAIRRMP